MTYSAVSSDGSNVFINDYGAFTLGDLFNLNTFLSASYSSGYNGTQYEHILTYQFNAPQFGEFLYNGAVATSYDFSKDDIDSGKVQYVETTSTSNNTDLDAQVHWDSGLTTYITGGVPTVIWSFTPQSIVVNAYGATYITFALTASTVPLAQNIYVSTVQKTIAGASSPNNGEYDGIYNQSEFFGNGLSSTDIQVTINDTGLSSGSESYTIIAQSNSMIASNPDNYSQYLARASFTINNNHPAVPKLVVQNISARIGGYTAASAAIADMSNPSGDNITQYGFYDTGTGGGYFELNGVKQASGQWIDLAPSALSNLTYMAGQTPGAETLYVDFYDATSAAWSANSSLTATTTLPVSNDLSGDGISDIVWQNEGTGDTWEWVMSGDSHVANIQIGNLANWSELGAGNFFGSGTDGLLWQNKQNGQVYDWSFSAGQHVAGSDVYLGSLPGWVASIGAFGGFGTTCIVWQNVQSGDTWEWDISNGKHLIGADINLSNTAGYTEVATGDFTGQGTSDMVWSNSATGDAWIWLMAAGQRSASVHLPNVFGYSLVAAGDFNGDGVTDLLWKSNSSGALWEWQMTKSSSIGQSIYLGTISGYEVESVGGFDNSGTDGIVWQGSAGDTWLWTMNNGQHSASVYLGFSGGYQAH